MVVTLPEADTAESGPSAVYFDSCDEAEKAGAVPLRSGAPGYRRGLDLDEDGEACKATVTSPPTPTSAALAPARAPIYIECYTDDDFLQGGSYTIATDNAGRPSFAAPWSARARSCEAHATVVPTTALEKAAYKTAKYRDGDVATLYTICAANDPDEVYASPGFTASNEQIPEINGALTLCPTHPQAGEWRQAVKRSRADAQLANDGRIFNDGTFLVGEDIKPGTYVVTDVKGCYWERQTKTSDIIANRFVTSARRVEVTIKSTDFAFHAEGCGQWRPA
ncbi:excalibur calcium-binding domain-containing protein [Asanoa sp. WMMD1127]|uniref:excalibur calcium-binding domain-containing protein n=1 Tax=Asanoa sp. WMMD1127 TaxID=3016107 RepID=UPI002416C8F6|nr:excalibur calcium-binding domain-containing protein [Asanoa sp. WMMD1127]MDG4823284.1 excalibur calcium-binding domain-containing protein [Asanoa sp. WMMD1127]